MQRARLGVFLLLLACSPANSRIVTLSFDGTFDTGGNTVFGQIGSAVPYTLEITYDTDLNSRTP